MSIKAIFGIIDSNAKEISSLFSETTHASSSLDSMKLNNTFIPKIATFEYNQWALDGSFNLFVDSESNKKANGWWSDAQTNWSGEMVGSIPSFHVSFTTPITSIGVTLVFGPENIAKKIQMVWWLEGEIVSSTTEYNNTEQVYVINNPVPSYDGLTLYFYSTVLPYRFIKVIRIDYGVGKEFTNEDITSLNCKFNTDLVSKEINVSTLNMSVYSEDAEFSILNPSGVYLTLKERQKIDIYVNKELHSRFYLKNWYSIDDYNYTFECDNMIGVMNNVIFNGGMYDNYPAVDLINEICEKAGFGVEYTDPDIESKNVSGWIGICSCREALQHVLFATRNIIMPRSVLDIITIGLVGNNTLVGEITEDDMYFGNKMLLKNAITHINIQTHKYILSDTTETIYSGNLKEGINVVKFNGPYSDLDISVDIGTYTITNYNCNYIKFELSSNAQVVISGKKYIDNCTLMRKNISNGKENTLEIMDAFMVSESNVEEILNMLEWYYTKRIERSVYYDYKMNGDVGDKIWISNIFGTQNNCVIESMDIDLVTSVSNCKVILNE